MSLLFLLSRPPLLPSSLPPFQIKPIQSPIQTKFPPSLIPSFTPTSISRANSSPPLLASSWQPATYVYPDPDPPFAAAETRKFRGELRKKMTKSKEAFGDDFEAVVDVCAEILSEFLHKEYGGPGTLIVEPFTDMLLALKEKNLPGAPLAARAALLWAQNYLDADWEAWFQKSVNVETSKNRSEILHP